MPINVVNQFELQLTSTDLTVGELKHRIQRRLGTPATMQFLFHKGNELNNENRSLSECGLNLDSTLILIVRGGDPQLGDEDGHGQERTFDHEDVADDNVADDNQIRGYGFNLAMPFNLYIAGEYYEGYAFNSTVSTAYYNNTLWNNDVVNHWQPSVVANSMTLHIMNSRSMNVLTTIDLEGTDTVLHLKEEIWRVLGYDIQSQRLDTGDSPLNNRSRIQDIPELMIHPVVYLTILPGYWFNTY